MQIRIVHDKGVFEELVNISFYIARYNEDAARRFLDACNETFEFPAKNKKAGMVRKFRDASLR